MVINTIADLAEHSYQRWLTTDQTELPRGAVEWIRDDIGEHRLSEEVGRIFGASIEESEKCYRFLKLTGVIEQARLRQLLTKQVLNEIELERTLRLRTIDSQFQGRINEQRVRLLRSPHEGAFPTRLLVIAAALVVGALGGLTHSSMGWSIGVLAGAGIAIGTRMMRMSRLVEQFIRTSNPGLEGQRRSVENDINDKRTHIDGEIKKLERLYAGTLFDTVQKKADLDKTTAPTDTVGYFMGPAAVTLVLMILPIFVTNAQWKQLSVPEFAPAPAPSAAPAPAPSSSPAFAPEPALEPAPSLAPEPAPVSDNNNVHITNSVVAEGVDSSQRPFGAKSTFTTGHRKLFLYFSYTGAISDNTMFHFYWYRDNKRIGQSVFTAKYESGNIWSWLDYGFEPGSYSVQTYVAEKPVELTTFNVVADTAYNPNERITQPDRQPHLPQRSFRPPSRDLRSDGWQESKESVTYEDK